MTINLPSIGEQQSLTVFSFFFFKKKILKVRKFLTLLETVKIDSNLNER